MKPRAPEPELLCPMMKLTKLEAAQRQLDVAAALFVSREDRLALHTLAGAAEEILGRLAQRGGQQSMFEGMRLSAKERLGRSVSVTELSKLVNESRNALKHANDPNEDQFNYDPNHAVVMLFRAMVDYQLVTGGLTDTRGNGVRANI